ncbi:MAG: hypothetical protein N2556_05880, partial [Anaerolineae bacterium]|nr:hypothetical protein [Anaerolineae bacterium]
MSSSLFCIVCGREFRPAQPDVVICHSCGGPPEATDHPRGVIALDKPQGTVACDQPEVIASTPQGMVGMEQAAFSPPHSEMPAASSRTFAAEADVPDKWQVGDN